MRILVIGGTGFISSRLVHFLLNAGHTAVASTRDKTRRQTLSQPELRFSNLINLTDYTGMPVRLWDDRNSLGAIPYCALNK